MAIIKFVMDWPVKGRAVETGRGAKLLDSGEFLPLVGLERHEIISPLSRIRVAIARWQPIASRVMIAPLMSSPSSNSGIALISLDLSPT